MDVQRRVDGTFTAIRNFEKKELSYAIKVVKGIKWSQFKSLMGASFSEWNRQNATRLGASLAFYSLLSLAPLLLVLISILGIVLGHSAAQRQVEAEVTSLVGPAAGKALEAFFRGAESTSSGIIASGLGVLALLFSASSVVIELQDALNTIWEVKAPDQSAAGMLKLFVKQRLFSFAMVLGIAFLLIVSLFISTWVTTLMAFSSSFFPGEGAMIHLGNIIVSFAVLTLLFAAIYKVIPDVHLEWVDVLLGGAVTSLLFTLGKWLLGLYLGRVSYSSIYGAAGSIVLLIAWVYYSAQIFFLGAEFTRQFAKHHGTHKQEHAAPQSRVAHA